MRWSDTDHLLAFTVDALAHLNWTVARIGQAWEIFKDVPKRPPKPVPRPTDGAPDDGEAVPEDRKTYGGGSFSLEELDRIIEQQTGAPHGIAREEG